MARIFGVPVTVLGGDQYLDVSDVMRVTVQHVAAQPFSPTILYYSDDPERIVNDGVLFRGTVTAGTPVRLYDYHENGTDPRRLVVVLSTTSTAPTTAQMVESFAGPNIDVMGVGHAVARIVEGVSKFGEIGHRHRIWSEELGDGDAKRARTDRAKQQAEKCL